MSVQTDLVGLGIADDLATEISAQISSGNGDFQALLALGHVPANELANQITSGIPNGPALTALSMPPAIASYLVDAISAANE